MIFRRRTGDRDRAAELTAGADAGAVEEPATGRYRGPWDRTETTADAGDGMYVDLGGLVVRGRPSLELRLQVEETAEGQVVTAALLAGPESGLELRAFAAPRSGGIWDEVRRDLIAEAAKRGGTATEEDGEFGPEVRLVVPARTPDGRQATQTSRVVGVEGPRWLLRGTFLGASATDPDPDGVVESAFRDVIVVRGSGPMKPRELLPMQLPQAASPDAEVVGGEEDSDDDNASGDAPARG